MTYATTLDNRIRLWYNTGMCERIGNALGLAGIVALPILFGLSLLISALQ